jgi:Xaa-Pro aminopeptidase
MRFYLTERGNPLGLPQIVSRSFHLEKRMSYAVYKARRTRLARIIGENCAVVLAAPSKTLRNGDVHYPFRQDSNFFYLTGFDEPGAEMVLIGGEHPYSVLFCAPKDPERELWEGARMGPKKAMSTLGFDEAHSNTDHGEKVDALMAKRVPLKVSLDDILGEMRLIKDAHEVALMRKAGEISAGAHRKLLSFTSSGLYEYEIEAQIARHFRDKGGDALHAYPIIVASGKNALTLHYTKNNARIKQNELVLVDAGCEYGGYASDITRTFPASGVFTKAQRALYDIVLSAQMEAIDMVRAGTPLDYIHDKACEVITEGLLKLGIIKASSLDVALMKQLYKPFFPHGTSHWLGMDVHDVGDYQKDPKTKRAKRKLEAGMVLTVEPGIYVHPCPNVPKEFWNIGIRIEDDVLVTESGNEVLSIGAPKDPNEIEQYMMVRGGIWW